MAVENYICVTGCLGAGTKTLAAGLAKELGFKFSADDFAGNPHLEAFYGDMHKHALPMSVWTLNQRLRQYVEMLSLIKFGSIKGAVQDHTIWELPIFPRMMNKHEDKMLSDAAFRKYMKLFKSTVGKLEFPQLIVYLDCRPETALARVEEKHRPRLERGISLEYIRDLRQEYERSIGEMESAGARVLRLDWETFLPVPEVARRVKEYSSKQPAAAPARGKRPMR